MGHKAVEPQAKVVTTTKSIIPPTSCENQLRPLDFALLRQQVSIRAVLEQLSWHPNTTRGVQWRGTCPLHGQTETADPKSRCFAVETDKNIYCCHRCGSQGNVLDLWIALRGKPILEAGWDMVETFGLEPPLLK